MKLEVCFLLVVTSISNNGKASLESFAPVNTHAHIEHNKSTDTSCYRPCKLNVKPRRCHYSFDIEPTILENGRTSISINGMTPGPPINVCVNDVVVVEVKNKIPNQDISIHWHGIEQKGTPYMDGVPMVTQCPITYGTTYKYAFVASSPGSYFYHADSVVHQSDGVYGSVIVNQPQPFEPHAALYDYDRSNENTVIVAAKFPKLLTGSLDDVRRMGPNDLVINEDEDNFKLFVMPGFAYRLRLINAIAIECPIVVSIDQHDLLVIASDGNPVKPVSARSVQLYPGERMDVVVRASQEVGGYWVNARGGGACAGLTTHTMLIYSGFNYTTMLQDDQNGVGSNADVVPPVYGQQLESLPEVSFNPKITSTYLGIDRNVPKFKETDNDFRYISDAIPKRPFYPASMSLQDNGVVQINNKSFLYPNSPILLDPRAVKAESFCYVEEENKHKEPQCLQILKAVEAELLEIALVNEGFGSNDSYTFHLHGYSMHVVATWQNPDSKPLSKEEFQKLDAEQKIDRNLVNPVIKDTVVVPNKGFTIVRVKVDKGGSWLLECRSCGLSSLPTAVLINIPQTLPKTITTLLSKCGSFRPPDVLLN